jgi:hypothetical protein
MSDYRLTRLLTVLLLQHLYDSKALGEKQIDLQVG